MKTGRRPKPAAQKEREGNPGKRKARKTHDGTEAKSLAAPRYLGKIAKEEWNRIVPILKNSGLYKSEDRAALESYCVAYEVFRKAYEEVKLKDGLIAKTKTGYLQQSANFTVMKMAMKEIRSLAVEFGMTPSARAALDANGNEAPRDPNDPHADFFEGQSQTPGDGEGAAALTH